MRFLGVFVRVTVWLKNSLRQSEGGVTGKGRVRIEKQAVKGKEPQAEASTTYVREKRHCVRVRKGSYGMVEIKILCFRWLSPFIKRVEKGCPRFA
jgi:hypothetical protein